MKLIINVLITYILLMIVSCQGILNSESKYTISKTQINASGINMDYSIAIPVSYSITKQPVPLVLALHYGGDRYSQLGSDFLNNLIIPALGEITAIMVAPVAPEQGDWTFSINEEAVLLLIYNIKNNYNIDTTRILLTGYSMGAIGTWYYAARHPDKFTAAIPMAGIPSGGLIPLISVLTVPTHVIYSDNDEIFSATDVENFVSDLQSSGSSIELKKVHGLSHYYVAGYITPLSESISWLEEVWE